MATPALFASSGHCKLLPVDNPTWLGSDCRVAVRAVRVVHVISPDFSGGRDV
jgi:hypothetical protein